MLFSFLRRPVHVVLVVASLGLAACASSSGSVGEDPVPAVESAPSAPITEPTPAAVGDASSAEPAPVQPAVSETP